MLVINQFIFREGLREGLESGEPCLMQDFGDPTVEPFDHPIGLGATRLNQPMVDALSAADLVKGMPTRRSPLTRRTKSIGKLLPIVRKDLLDDEGDLLEETGQEGPRNLGGPPRMGFEIDPPGGSINRREEIARLGLIGHSR